MPDYRERELNQSERCVLVAVLIMQAAATTAGLARAFGVAMETIRRDMDIISRSGAGYLEYDEAARTWRLFVNGKAPD